MVLIEQISALIDFVESHKDLALGHCNRTMEGRSLLKRYWMECAQILNSVQVDCPTKTPTEWRVFYNEYKSKLVKKIKCNKREISATGGGPAKTLILTPLQERLYTVLGRDLGEPLPGVRHTPVLPIISFPLPEVAGNSPNIELDSADNSFSILNNYTVAIASDDQQQIQEHVESQRPLTPVISLEQETVEGQASSVDRPPNRRRRQRLARRHAVEEREHAALDAAQARLEAIEGRNADAILQQAQATLQQAQAMFKQAEVMFQQVQATNNMAAAIERLSSTADKIVDLMGHLTITSQPK